MNNAIIVIFIVLMAVLVAYAPQLLRLRIRIFRWLRWNRLADWHERHFVGLLIFARVWLILFLAVAVVILLAGVFQGGGGPRLIQ